MSPGPWVLVLDVGSSSVRATLFDERGSSLAPTAGMRRRYRWRTEPEGAMECDAQALLREVVGVIDAAVEQVRDEGSEIAGVTIAAFWHSVLGLDGAGAPSTPVYGWGDTRAREVAIDLGGTTDEAAYHARTGCYLHPSYPATRIAWIRRAAPGAFARSAAWVSFPEYLEAKLLGVRRCSLSMASGSGLLNLRQAAWDGEAARLAGISVAQLSPLVDAADAHVGLVPEFAARWPELAAVPWFPALGDGACANAGSGAVGQGLLGLTIGTSAAVRALWRPVSEVQVPHELWCYRLDRRWWVAGGALSNGGNAVAYLRRTLLLGDSAEVDARVAELPADGHGLTILPFLRVERGPGWLREHTAATVGLTESTRPEEILRAWIEALSYRVAWVVDRLEEVVGPAREIVASGGALHSSPAWAQILADTLDRPLSLAAESEDTSRGAALVAWEGLGAVSDLRLMDPPTARVFTPRPAQNERHRSAMARQQRLLQTLAGGVEPVDRGERRPANVHYNQRDP